MPDYLDSGLGGTSMYGGSAPLPTTITDPQTAALVVKEKVPAASDSDTATRQTVQKMCEYIQAGTQDDVCKWWAHQAITKYAQGADDPKAKCWGVWWLVKHAVRFQKDEPKLFAVGEPEALDLLIAPAVLVRSEAPAEDCDGFTMLICCLLKIMGVNCSIVTVAADPADPSRWSHVFPMAKLSDTNLPLDASHGKYPGWMLPREHIFRWQAWDLSGNPIQEFPPQMNTLHGYFPGRSSLK